jgi:xylulokinase
MRMTDGLVLAIDIGTTTVKAAAFDLGGGVRFSHASDYPTTRAPGGVVEQSPDDWLARVDEVLARLQEQGLAGQVWAVGITSQVNTHVFVDAAGAVLAPAMVWQDGRCAAQAAAIDARIDAGDRLRWWGAPLPVDASHALARMAWMAAERPEIWARTYKVMLPKDFVVMRLTGTWRSDPMSNIGLVGTNLRYLPDLLELMPGAAERLVPLADAQAVAGMMRLGPGLAEVPVSVGIMDAWAAMYGVGLKGEGDAVYLSGTSEVLGIVSGRAQPEPGVLVFPRNGGVTLHAGPTQSGGASVAWFCKAFGVTPEQMEQEAAGAGATPLFLPHLSGERAPLWDAAARGAFLGLGAGMGRGEMARAVYEGVAYSARLLLASLEASAMRRAEVILCGGGGFRSDLWNQIRADVLGRPLQRLAVPDAGLVGAAAIASVAAGLHG